MDTMTDESLETRIHEQALRLQFARTPAARREAMRRLRELHAQRSAERVAEMEREQGLR